MTKRKDAQPSPLPRLLDLVGVAEHLGVPEGHVRRLVAERRIPFLKWGRLLRFDPEEIAAWLDAARQPVAPPSFPPGFSMPRTGTLGPLPGVNVRTSRGSVRRRKAG